MTLSVSLRVPLSPFIGYGNDGIGIASELIEYGVDVHIAPGNLVNAPLPAQVAALFTKDKKQTYDLYLHHLDPDSFVNAEGFELAEGFKVGWTMWEFSNLLNSAGVDSLRERLAVYDLFLAYDENTAESLRAYYDGPIQVLQGGFMPENYPYVERNFFDPDHFRFCMVGQLHDRKDPYLTIQAFNELKDDPNVEFEAAELHLKNGMPGALFNQMNEVYKTKKIRVYNEIWDKDTLDRFYSQMHVLVAPSRGEGKNMPALEFLSTGGPVIATNWGGHTGWLRTDIGYPLNYTLAPVDRDTPDTLNARADIEHLKSLMLQAYNNRDEAKRKGELAAEIIPASMSWESVIRRLFQVLADYNPKIGALAAAARFENGYDD